MSELGAGTRGSSLGLEALQIASIKTDPSFFQDREICKIKTENRLLYQEVKTPSAPRIDGISVMYDRIQNEVSHSLEHQEFPCVISGDHSNAGGTIAGIKKAFPQKRLGVIWVDAHADLHSPYTSPTGNVHGMPLATALGEDNLENKVRDPEEEAIWHWNEMKGTRARLQAEDIFFLGLRDTEEPEDRLREKHQIPNITVDELREMGVKAAAAKAREHLADCDIIYLSFDVDSLDPIVSVGTGTPVDEGFSEDEARDLLLELVEDSRIITLEMVEINPLLDMNGNSMAEASFRILKPVVEKLEAQAKS